MVIVEATEQITVTKSTNTYPKFIALKIRIISKLPDSNIQA